MFKSMSWEQKGEQLSGKMNNFSIKNNISMPLFVAGSQSPNPSGRPKKSAQSIKGKLERFIRRNYTMTRMNRIFDELSARDQAALYKDLLPYILPRQASESLSAEDIEKLHEKFEQAIKKANAI